MSADVCDKCGAERPADEGVPGDCSSCGAPPGHRPMTPRQIRRMRESQYSAEDLVNHAVHQCGVPALGLCYVGVFNAGAGLFATLFGALGIPFVLMKGFPPLLLLLLGVYLIVSAVLTFVAGLWMQRAKMYPLCVMGCVLAISGAGPVWFVGAPIGIYGLFVLFRPRVRQGFAADRPDFDPDAAG